jgi:DNA-binding PadR family transcriptional regulator
VANELTHDAELDATVAELERAGLLETYTRPDGRIAYRLTPQGAAVGRMLAMGDEKADALLGALLDDA